MFQVSGFRFHDSGTMRFTHLHVHSHYSLLDGLAKIDQLLDACQELKMPSIALTDHGSMYGAVEFFQKAKKRGMRAIIGSEVYLAPHGMHMRRPNIDDKRYHLVLLVKNKEGYQNLVRLTTQAYLEGFYYKPRIDKELLKKHTAGLIGLSACLQGEIPQAIISAMGRSASNGNVNLEQAEKLALEYQEIFGPGNFYLEIEHHPGIKEQALVNQALIKIAKKHNIPLVATNDVHYIKPEDAEAQDVLMAINTDKRTIDQNRLTMKSDDFSLRSQEQMIQDFKDVPEAIANTQKIVEQCNFEFELDKIQLPYFEVPNGQTPDEYLKNLCQKGLKNRYGEQPEPAVLERLEYELSVIKQTGFAPYFLIVQDFVNWAKSQNIVVGPGRGCLLPGTKILLKDGRQKNIEDIKPKERVISIFGNKRRVKKVLNYDIDEEIAVIKSKIPPFDLKLTKDHKVLAAKHKMCPLVGTKKTICKPSCSRACKKNLWKDYKLEWVKAQDLKKNDFLVYPIVKHRQIKEIKFDLLNFNSLDSHLKGNNQYVWYEIGTNKIIQKKIKRYIKLDKKFAQLLGFYISEGWSRTRRKHREATIGFGFHRDEKEYIEKVRKLLKQIFGLESTVTFHKTRNSCQVHAYSRIVARFLEKLCGKHSQNKHIPYQIFESSDEIVVSLLTSLLQGDGSHKDTMRVSFDSNSLNLVSQVKMLMARLGIMPSIKIREHKRKKWHPSYKLTISGKQLLKFNQLFKEFQIPIKKQKFYRNDTFIWKNYLWFPIKEIAFKRYKGKVYDLTVEKDASYIANEIAVHNSAAGSIVSYLLNITDVDPLKYNLLFERFLNPERVSMPDIDLDFADDRRDEVIEYVRNKYGQNHVAQIITFGTMASRAAIRDVGRALGYSYNFCDQIAKMIPFGLSLERAIHESQELHQTYESDESAKKLIDMARQLEGVARHASTHAAGVVITKEDINNLIPRQHPTQNDQTIVTQYEMHSIEALGLLKMDFLGLKTLTVIQNTLNQIKEQTSQEINLAEIPLNDRKTYHLLQKGNTTGVFQLESQGMKKYLKELKPTQFEDIVAIVALYRPGPMEFIPEFIARKHGYKKIEYLHPRLKPILENTYGICVFQEQLMRIARDLAGFTPTEADVLRKAVGKKIKKLLDEQKDKMIEGMVKNEIDQETAEKIWQFVEPFARYGFNQAHSCCYALIGYQTAYLKAHYPTEFMAALMTSEQNDIERIAFLVDECQQMGIKVLPPDINESDEDFTVVSNQQIRFGLKAIKNVGHNVVKAIVQERKNSGQFKSITDFVERVESKDLNKKSLESLIKCGALDAFGERNQLLASLEQILNLAREIQKAKQNGQISLFDNQSAIEVSSFKLQESIEATKKERLTWEKELLGLYISEHPLKDYQEQLNKLAIPCQELSQQRNGRQVKIGGIVNKIQKINTRTGQPMLFVEIEDLSGRIEVLVFPKVLEQTATSWQEDKVVLVSGRLSDRGGKLNIICDNVKVIE
jgi:DNA polymerase III alpha subunit